MLLLLLSQAHAAFWDRPLKVGYSAGVSLIVNLGTPNERARLGVGVGAQVQRFWAESPYYSDAPLQPAPVLTLGAQVGWTHPVVFSEVIAMAGPMHPRVVADGGFIPLVAAQAGGGLQMATDGSAGPVLTASVISSSRYSPIVEGRFEVTHWKGWHAPRVLVGPMLALNCCSYLQ